MLNHYFNHIARSAWRTLSAGLLLNAESDELRNALLAERPPGSKYSYLPESLLAMRNRITADQPDLTSALARFTVAVMGAQFDGSRAPLRLPASVVSLYPRNIMRIKSHLDARDDGYYSDVMHDWVRKDLAILAFRLIPLGAEYAQPDAGVPRSMLLNGGLVHFVRVVLTILRCGGFRGFLELHAHADALDDFSPEGWARTYRILAELLELNPRIRGWFSSSWFLDPELAKISPHLTYLRQTPGDAPLTYLYVMDDSDGSSGALAKSPTRRRLFQEGRYTPRIYMRICPRQQAISWLGDSRGGK